MRRPNSVLPSKQWIKEEIKLKFKNYLETNEKENTTLQDVWDATKAVLKGKFVARQAHSRSKFNTTL